MLPDVRGRSFRPQEVSLSYQRGWHELLGGSSWGYISFAERLRSLSVRSRATCVSNVLGLRSKWLSMGARRGAFTDSCLLSALPVPCFGRSWCGRWGRTTEPGQAPLERDVSTSDQGWYSQSNLGGAGDITCLDCGHSEEYVSFIHGHGDDQWSVNWLTSARPVVDYWPLSPGTLRDASAADRCNVMCASSAQNAAAQKWFTKSAT